MITNLKFFIAVSLTSALVTSIYMVFESALHHALELVWIDALDTQSNRLMVVPLTLGLGLCFFAAQHFLFDQTKTKKRSILVTLLLVLAVGFLSLFAGASLGPEAVLIPAAVLSGQLVAVVFKSKESTGLLALAGTVALFVAFFNSLLGGLLGFYLAQKAKRQDISLLGYIGLASSATVALLILKLFSDKGSFTFPASGTTVSLVSVLLFVGFFIAGMVYQRLLAKAVSIFKKLREQMPENWLTLGLLGGGGLCLLFLLGGPLVQFTGNESIVPVFHKAEAYGLVGLLWIFFIKTLAIAWSAAMRYRGGLVFPTMLVASSFVAIATLYTTNFHITWALLIFLAGSLVADRKDAIILNEEH